MLVCVVQQWESIIIIYEYPLYLEPPSAFLSHLPRPSQRSRLGSLCLMAAPSVQSLSPVQLFATPWTAARIPCPSSTLRASSNSCPSSWWCHPTISSSVVPFSSCLQSFPASGSFSMSQSFSSSGQSIGASAFSINPSNEYSGLISFRMDCLDLLAVQGTLKSLLQHHSSKASVLQCSAFFIVQL